jgi:ribose transport system substrate-binding protein
MLKKAHVGAVAAALALATTVAACGDSDSSGSSTAGGGSGEDIDVTFVAALVNDSYFVTIRCGAEDAARRLGVNLKWTGPTSADVAEEISAFSAAAVNEPDAMVLAPFSDKGFGGAVRPLMQRGVPVALSGQAIDPADGYVTYITNFEEGGNSLSDEIGELTGGTGTMAIVATSTGNPTDSDRYTGLVPLLEERYPNLKVLEPQYANNSSARAASITSSLIQGNPDLRLVYATSGPQAVGAASAIAAAKAGDRIRLISFDSNAQQIELLKRGQLAATVAQSPFITGQLTVRAVVDYVRENGKGGDPVPASDRTAFTPTMLLTPENVDSPEGKQYQYLEQCSAGEEQGGRTTS